jgi:hypothetical protein
MNHDFECKCFGKISDKLLQKLKALALSLEYKTVYQWQLKETEFISEEVAEIKQTIQELNSFSKVRDLYSAAFSLLPKMTYGPEHSDLFISKRNEQYYKIHIPIFTNSMVGFMWPGHDVKKNAYVTQMEEGSVYLFNNIAKHCMVNLSQDDRYHLLLEFRELECVE